MVTKKKVNLAEVLKAMNKTCPKCNYSITPAEAVRVDWERVRCPKCGATFDAAKARGQKGANS